LSDTSPVTFSGHHLPPGRYVLVTDEGALRCTADYQRSWFHLFLAELYLARLQRLRAAWGLPRPAEEVVSLNELAQLRAYALRLLDDFGAGSDVRALGTATSAMKLRVSLMAQAAMATLRARAEAAPADAERLRADAGELGYIRWQPTADTLILRSLGLETAP
ncbi:MAG TPA: hypothetical protein VFO85_14575, partial [Vicinamibacteria bacterium]|nr:hypothetical protein [Vicinamibacteria bacterium]